MNIEAFFKISYGLFVIATKHGSKQNAYIANTAFQVTADPPQIAISCNKNNFSCHLIQSSGRFSISVLNQNAKAETIGLLGYQSGKDINKLKNLQTINSSFETPIVTEDCIAWFDCKVVQSMDVGSHIVFIGEITENDLLDADATPLDYAYYREVKKGHAPKNAPTYIEPSKLENSRSDKQEQYGKKYKCLACGYIYDPSIGDEENNIAAGTPFEELPDDWTCPTCGSPKEMFEPI